ncbi:MAG: diaminopimelate epimerase, partial [Clostridia bacterium]|nr:diaminopimelate epimerase [Clostridia bacterium]
KKIKVITQNDRVMKAVVDMGRAELSPEKIPVLLDGESVIGRHVIIGGTPYDITCVSMGNPHCVVFVDDVEGLDLEKIGPKFEYDTLFPERVNTEFIQIAGDNVLKMRVWERGSGETLACGTGACAAAVAAVLNGHCDRERDIRVILLGGELHIRYTDDAVYMTGDAKKVFEGTTEI